MKQIIITVITIVLLIMLSCNNRIEQKNIVENFDTTSHIVETKEKEILNIIMDTLFFDKHTNMDLLNSKYENSISQLEFYKTLIDPKHKDFVINIVKPHETSELIYLGKWSDLNFLTSYHIITEFTIIGIGEMLSPRGHTKLVCINEDKSKIIVYSLGMPDERPISIKDNQLLFLKDTQTIKLSISGGLPLFFCVPEIDCY